MDERSSECECDILIVGAGLSGLTAAYRAKKIWSNDRIKIVEAKDRVGGRLLSVTLTTGDRYDTWDLGGSWVGKTQVEVLSLLEELEMETYPQYFKGTKFLQVGSDNRIKTYESRIPKLSLVSLLDLSMLLRRLESDRGQVSPDRTEGNAAEKLFDSVTGQAYLDRHIWTRSVMDMTQAAYRTVTGTEMAYMSTLFMMDYANAAGRFEDLIESSPESAQGMKIKGGSQSLCLKLAEKVGEDNILLNSAVNSVAYDNQGVTVTTTSTITDDCTTFRAKFVIMAIPPTLMKTIKFTPHLPAVKSNLFNAYRPGHLIKIILTYSFPFWRELGFSGEIVTNGGPSFNSSCSTGPLCITFDATTDSGSAALVAFIGGKQAEEYDALTSEERKDAVLKSLEQFFPAKSVYEYVTYVEKNWRLDRYCGGSPIAVLSTGVGHLTQHSRTPLGNRVFFCGSEFATHWTGFMCGAVQSANMAVHALHDFRLPEGMEPDLTLEKSRSEPDQQLITVDGVVVITSGSNSIATSSKSKPSMRGAAFVSDTEDISSDIDVPTSSHQENGEVQAGDIRTEVATVAKDSQGSTPNIEQTEALGQSKDEVQSDLVVEPAYPHVDQQASEKDGDVMLGEVDDYSASDSDLTSKGTTSSVKIEEYTSDEQSVGAILSAAGDGSMAYMISSNDESFTDESIVSAVENLVGENVVSLADELSDARDSESTGTLTRGNGKSKEET